MDKVLITTTLGGRGLEKKIVVYISPEVRREFTYICQTSFSKNMGDFLAIVKEKNFIEVVSRSINQVSRSQNRLDLYKFDQAPDKKYCPCSR